MDTNNVRGLIWTGENTAALMLNITKLSETPLGQTQIQTNKKSYFTFKQTKTFLLNEM